MRRREKRPKAALGGGPLLPQPEQGEARPQEKQNVGLNQIQEERVHRRLWTGLADARADEGAATRSLESLAAARRGGRPRPRFGAYFGPSGGSRRQSSR